MKIRSGFVSNSSSSSFILKRKAFKEEDYLKIKNFLMERDGMYETEIYEDSRFLYGEVEAHNEINNFFNDKNYSGPEDKKPLAELLQEMIVSTNTLEDKKKSFYIAYGDYATPEHLDEPIEDWKGEKDEDSEWLCE